jgi:hypothetical protein
MSRMRSRTSLGGHDPQIAAWKLLYKHRGTWGITVGLELRGIEMTLLLSTRRTLMTSCV